MSCVGGGFICVCTTYRINEHDTFLKLHFTKSKWKIHARIRYLDFLEFFFPHFWYECLNEMLMWKFSFFSFIKECHYFDFFFFFFGYIGPKPITTSIFFIYFSFFFFSSLLCFVLFFGVYKTVCEPPTFLFFPNSCHFEGPLEHSFNLFPSCWLKVNLAANLRQSDDLVIWSPFSMTVEPKLPTYFRASFKEQALT